MASVLDSGWYVLGPQHSALEAELSEYIGVAETIGVGNGTDALQLALLALGVGRGSTVLTAANAGGYTSAATRAIGAVPVYADVDPKSLLLTVESIENALVSLTAPPDVIVVTHLFGAAAEALEDCRVCSWTRHQGHRGLCSVLGRHPRRQASRELRRPGDHELLSDEESRCSRRRWRGVHLRFGTGGSRAKAASVRVGVKVSGDDSRRTELAP